MNSCGCNSSGPARSCSSPTTSMRHFGSAMKWSSCPKAATSNNAAPPPSYWPPRQANSSPNSSACIADDARCASWSKSVTAWWSMPQAGPPECYAMVSRRWAGYYLVGDRHGCGARAIAAAPEVGGAADCAGVPVGLAPGGAGVAVATAAGGGVDRGGIAVHHPLTGTVRCAAPDSGDPDPVGSQCRGGPHPVCGGVDDPHRHRWAQRRGSRGAPGCPGAGLLPVAAILDGGPSAGRAGAVGVTAGGGGEHGESGDRGCAGGGRQPRQSVHQ